MRVLLVEDEPAAAQMLAKGLREHAYAVDASADGDDASFRLATTDYDAVILDVMLPRKDGLDVAREARANGSVVPILMLTARDAVQARISGLDSGADDYLTKPFDFGELLARLRARYDRLMCPSSTGRSVAAHWVQVFTMFDVALQRIARIPVASALDDNR